VSFSVQGETLGSDDVITKSFTIGTAGAVLGVFVIGTDYLVSSVVSQGEFGMPLSGRGHKIRITETSTLDPHIITALTFSHKLKRLQAR